MSTLTDLRRTLDRHADDVADPATVARTTAVHHRIAVVRRRRAAGAGVLAAVVLAGVAGVAIPKLGDSSALPTGPVVLGERVPGSITSLGYAFDATGESQVVRGSGRIRLAAAATPRLISWTLQDATTVRFTMPGPEVHRTSVTHFGDFLYVPAGQAATIPVRAPGGSVGVATYALSDRVTPAGYTRDGVTYRDTVAGSRLLVAAIGDPGETSVTSSFVPPHGLVSIGVMCANLPHGDVVNVSFGNGGAVSSSGCDSDGSFDPGASSFTSFRSRHPGRAVRVHAWISRGFRDTAVIPAGSVPGLRIGVGVYGPVAQAFVGRAVSVPTVIESGGHTWRLTRTSGPRVASSPTDRIASVLWRTRGHTRVTVRLGAQTTGSESPGGQGALPGLWLPAGATLRASVGQATGTLGVAVYSRAD